MTSFAIPAWSTTIQRRTTSRRWPASSKVAGFAAIFPDLEEDLQDIIATGDPVATRWVLTGSQQQEFMGIAATGQTIRVEGMNFYRLENGRVTDVWTQFDGLGMMQQLGAVPA